MALRAEKIPVPNAEQRYDHGQIISQRRVQEMLVHLLRAGAQRAEMRGADLQHDRQPRRGPQRITPANPIPHLKQVFKRNAELNRRWSNASRSVRALLIVSSVVKVLETTIASVVSRSMDSSARCISAPSIFDTKWTSRSAVPKGCSASQTIFGPSSEPPMPILTIERIGLPV